MRGARPLVERSKPLGELSRRWDAARSGRGGVVVVEGPAGMGKTALLSAFRARVDAPTLASYCGPMSQAVPGTIARDWFGPLLRRSPPGTAPFDGPGALLGERDIPLGDLAYATRWVLDGLTSNRPLLLVVDDVHWADGLSLGLLDHLSALLPELPCLLVLGQRTGEAVVEPEYLARVRSRAALVRLRPLTARGARTLVADLPEDVAESLVERSDGNPLFLHELADGRRAGIEGVPTTVVDVVLAMLARLSPDTEPVARALAVLGRHAEVVAVAELAGLPPDHAQDALAELVRAELVAAGGQPIGPGAQVRIAHDLLADALLSDVPAAELSAMHRRAAELLQARGAPDAVVAGHLLRTAPAGRADVRDFLARLGRRAQSVDSPAMAATYLRRAAAEGGEDDPELLRSAAQAVAATGAVDEATALWRRAEAAAPDVGARARLAAEAGDVLLGMGRTEAATAIWRRHLAALGPEHDGLRKQLVVRLAMHALLGQGTRPEFAGYLEALGDRPPEQDTPEDRVLLAAAAVGTGMSPTGKAPAAADLAWRAWGGGRLLAEVGAGGAPLHMVTGVLDWTGSFARARTVCDAVVEGARSSGSTHAMATASQCRARMLFSAGRVQEAMTDLALAWSMRQFGWSLLEAGTLQLLVSGHLARGDVAAARALRGTAEELVATAEPVMARYARFALGDLDLAGGDLVGAADHFRSVGESVGDNRGALDWRGRLAVALHRAGRVEEAAGVAAENLELARDWGAPRLIAEAAYVAAVVCPEPEPLLREVQELTDDPELRLMIVRAEAALALAELSCERDPAEAVALADAAHRRATEEDLGPLAGRAAVMLARCGRAPVAGSAPLALLSPAERRVAELVAAGMSNREAAGHLFVTVKAVEWHLSSIYRKLGLTSRRQLADLLPREV